MISKRGGEFTLFWFRDDFVGCSNYIDRLVERVCVLVSCWGRLRSDADSKEAPFVLRGQHLQPTLTGNFHAILANGGLECDRLVFQKCNFFQCIAIIQSKEALLVSCLNN